MQGDLYDNESLVKAIKQVDVVISTVGHMQLADQVKIISAIKEAGNVKVCIGMTQSIFVIESVQSCIISNGTVFDYLCYRGFSLLNSGMTWIVCMQLSLQNLLLPLRLK